MRQIKGFYADSLTELEDTVNTYLSYNQSRNPRCIGYSSGAVSRIDSNDSQIVEFYYSALVEYEHW